MVVPQYPYPVVGGLERQANALSNSLTDIGLGVQIVSGRTQADQPADHLVDGVRVHRLPWSKSRLFRIVRMPIGLFGVMYRQRNAYDVVHLHQLSWLSLFSLMIARLFRKPVLAKVPGIGVYGIPGLAESALGSVKLALLRKANGVVAMSNESRMELQAVGIPPGKILLTPNGISVEHDAADGVSLQDREGGCGVVFVGRLSEEKSLDTLLRAWRRIVEHASGAYRLELWGSGPMEDRLKRLSDDLGISNSVIFRGHVERVRARLKEMQVFVLPSRTEGNSNAVLEAMAAGLPIVSTRVGGTPMQVGPEGIPFLIAPGDELALYESLSKLLADQDLRRRLGAAMRRRALEYFDISVIARTYAAAYQLLAAGHDDQLGSIANPVVGCSACSSET